MADAIPKSRLEVIPKAGHMAPYENPAVANDVILEVPEQPGGSRLMTEATGEAIVTTPVQLKELVEHLRSERRFALDTEFVSEDTFEPVLCLIQVATRERLAVIDPLAGPRPGSVLESGDRRAVEVVMHAAGEDLRICLLRTGPLTPPRLRRADGSRA